MRNDRNDHDILVVGAPPEAFSGEFKELLQNPRVVTWSKHDVRQSNPIPAGTTRVFYYPDTLGRDRTLLLESFLLNNGLGKKSHKAGDIESLRTVLRMALLPEEPNDGSNNGGPKDLANNAGDTPPLSGREVKLAPPGEKWGLGDFVRANADPNVPNLAKEARRVHQLATESDWPDAQPANIEQHIRKMRLRRNKGGKIVPTNHPVVDKFLEWAGQFAGLLPDFARAILEERQAFQGRITQLEEELQAANKGREEVERRLRETEELMEAELGEVLERIKKTAISRDLK